MPPISPNTKTPPCSVWRLLRKATEEQLSFHVIRPFLENIKFIEAPRLWKAINIAVSDSNCTFQDIVFMLEKVEVIDAHHLRLIFLIARRKKGHWLDSLIWILEKSVDMNAKCFTLLLQVALNDNRCTYQKFSRLLQIGREKGVKFNSIHVNLINEIQEKLDASKQRPQKRWKNPQRRRNKKK